MKTKKITQKEFKQITKNWSSERLRKSFYLLLGDSGYSARIKEETYFNKAVARLRNKAKQN